MVYLEGKADRRNTEVLLDKRAEGKYTDILQSLQKKEKAQI